MADLKGYAIEGTVDAYSFAGQQGRAGAYIDLGADTLGEPEIFGVVYPTTPDAFFEFFAYDVAPGLRFVQVLAELANESRRDVVFDENAFRGLYAAGGSTRTGAGTQANPYHFKVRPAGGWPRMPNGELHRLIPHLVDAAGNELVIP